MEITLSLLPNQKGITFVDQMIHTYMTVYDLPSKREICFVVHELMINAVEAMNETGNNEKKSIELQVFYLDGTMKITVIDSAGGIPNEHWEDFLQLDTDIITFSDRGRGLLFIKNMVDEIWFKNVSEEKFL
ncbi:ATP-binding protein [Robertmurraya andreesenii]|uniref:Serine/threonine-protein kinase RsbW n=1 Tax=Anoxybacillus andreesenii TaxID=1325932 RepID=A0ABT9V3A5_9BACL|nr:ATP-binding protein [Robertmurraya andreesenii]MDQ0155423.1 serine/threonine-protein kinase RsbW [Robertmurraya andreesenii]